MSGCVGVGVGVGGGIGVGVDDDGLGSVHGGFMFVGIER